MDNAISVPIWKTNVSYGRAAPIAIGETLDCTDERLLDEPERRQGPPETAFRAAGTELIFLLRSPAPPLALHRTI